MRVPSSTPAGIATCNERSRCTVPAPRQMRHGLRMVLPAPLQVGQVRLDQEEALLARGLCRRPGRCRRSPPGVLLSSEPVPAHASQATRVGTRSVTLVPENACGEVDLHCLADVGAGPGASATAAPAHDVAEHLVENPAQIAAAEIEALRESAAAIALLERRVAITIISARASDRPSAVIGFVQFLEAGFGLRHRRDCGRDGTASRACDKRASGRRRSRLFATPRVA